MMLYHLERIGRIAAAWAVAIFFASLTFMAWRVYSPTKTDAGLRTNIYDVFNEARNVTVATLRPCEKDKPDTCGLIPAARQIMQDTGSTVKIAGTQIQQTSKLADAASQSIQGVATHLEKTADAGTGLLTSAKGTTDKLPTAIESIQADFDATKVPIAAIGDDAVSLNALLKDAAIHQALENFAGMTDSGNGILLDARKVADKETADWLKPVRWYMQPVKKSSDLLDIGAALARHMP